MDSTLPNVSNENDVVSAEKEPLAYADVAMVDPFLVEALQNPRHRLTILHMELDIQKFLQSPDQRQFEFQHFATSYLRLAAHRVAQHYGLQTMIQENVGGQGIHIIVRKKDDTKDPCVSLSDIPAKEPENGNHKDKKFVIKPRPHKSCCSDISSEMGLNRNSLRTVDERIEDYGKARARIFNSPGSSESEDGLRRTTSDGKEICFSTDESGGLKNSIVDFESNTSSRENSSSSRVAILRDIEKDRNDPDYDRSYGRYVRNFPATQNISMMPANVQNFQAPYVQYDSLSLQMPSGQAFPNHRYPIMGPSFTMALNQPSRDASVYMPRPTQSMMYAYSYDQFRHAVYQAPFYQQPLSFGYSHNYS
ncbi:hypothetical protein Leryth_021877 [Lithospermum erythrorhizon]|nr:hypothetical protein Leryth_021877 [Lithospermum erythrorhizon]